MKLSELKDDDYIYVEKWDRMVIVEDFKENYALGWSKDFDGVICETEEERIGLPIEDLLEWAIEYLYDIYGCDGWDEEANDSISDRTKKLFEIAIDSLIRDVPEVYVGTDREVEME